MGGQAGAGDMSWVVCVYLVYVWGTGVCNRHGGWPCNAGGSNREHAGCTCVREGAMRLCGMTLGECAMWGVQRGQVQHGQVRMSDRECHMADVHMAGGRALL